jgi:uncharacterized membrane protein YbaN (DUF454 family)
MNRIRRYAWACVGLVLVGIGAVGVVVPGLPTTIFLLVACYCFLRSCPAMGRWLQEHRIFGPYLRRVADGGGIPRSVKLKAWIFIWVGIGVGVLVGRDLGTTFVVVLVALGLVGTAAVQHYSHPRRARAFVRRTLGE